MVALGSMTSCTAACRSGASTRVLPLRQYKLGGLVQVMNSSTSGGPRQGGQLYSFLSSEAFMQRSPAAVQGGEQYRGCSNTGGMNSTS